MIGLSEFIIGMHSIFNAKRINNNRQNMEIIECILFRISINDCTNSSKCIGCAIYDWIINFLLFLSFY